MYAVRSWIEEQRLNAEVVKSPEGDKFGCRLKVYLTDSGVEKDPAKWETEVAFKVV